MFGANDGAAPRFTILNKEEEEEEEEGRKEGRKEGRLALISYYLRM